MRHHLYIAVCASHPKSNLLYLTSHYPLLPPTPFSLAATILLSYLSNLMSDYTFPCHCCSHPTQPEEGPDFVELKGWTIWDSSFRKGMQNYFTFEHLLKHIVLGVSRNSQV